MVKLRAALVVGALAALGACFPPALDETGKRCVLPFRQCGPGYICLAGHCAVEGSELDGGDDAGDASTDAGTDAGLDAGHDGGADAGDAGSDAGEIPFDVNLLANPGFEQLTADGGLRAWRASSGALGVSTAAHDGGRAAQLSVAAQQPALLSDLVVTAPTALGMLFCGQAWVRSENDAGHTVTLFIRDRASDGGLDQGNGMPITTTTQWKRVQEIYASRGLGSLDVRITATRLDAGDGVLVDDALLFRASGTTCVFP